MTPGSGLPATNGGGGEAPSVGKFICSACCGVSEADGEGEGSHYFVAAAPPAPMGGGRNELRPGDDGRFLRLAAATTGSGASFAPDPASASCFPGSACAMGAAVSSPNLGITGSALLGAGGSGAIAKPGPSALGRCHQP